ncbi:MAG: hypothetical protein IT219_03855 [Bacteroidales bacterium]|nr:hypothetical protein [Bacteroidales bacterium]
MKRENTSKAIKLIMAFAIFWMVIGDLITYHQEKIFGTNYYEHHTPFTKPGSKDDGKTSHAKFSKDFDKQSFVKLDVIASDICDLSLPTAWLTQRMAPKPYLMLRHLFLKHIQSFRGPPAFL